MKKKLFLLVLCIILGLSQKAIFSRNLDLLILLDSGLEESIYNPNSGFLITALATALKEKAAPIIVSGVVLNNFLDKNSNPTAKSVHKAPFDSKNFQVFKCVNEDLYLIIPNEYKRNVDATIPPTLANNLKNSLGVNDDELKLGLRINKKELFEKVDDFNQLKEELHRRWTGWREQIGRWIRSGISLVRRQPREINVSKIKEMFIFGPEVKGQNFASWNIYLSGHGWYVTNYRNLQRIAGLMVSDIKNLLDFFNNQIDTNCLYYSTCFGGGKHADLINKHFLTPQPDANYIIISGALTDAMTWAPSEIDTPLKFKEYFTDLHNIFSSEITNAESFKQALKKISPQIKYKVEDWTGISSIPLVRIPGMHKFSTVKLDNVIEIITASQGNSLNISNKRGVIVYTKDINFPIDMGTNSPAIISMVPRNSFVHHFKQVKGTKELKDFLKESIFGLKESINKNFIFDELNLFNYLKDPWPNKFELNLIDVIIKKSFRTESFIGIPKLGDRIKTAGTIYFKMKNDNDNQILAYKGEWLERSWTRQGWEWEPTIRWQIISQSIIDSEKQRLLSQEFEPFEYESWEKPFEEYLRNKNILPIVQ